MKLDTARREYDAKAKTLQEELSAKIEHVVTARKKGPKKAVNGLTAERSATQQYLAGMQKAHEAVVGAFEDAIKTYTSKASQVEKELEQLKKDYVAGPGANAAEKTKLQGEWVAIAAEDNGKPLSKLEVKSLDCRVMIKGNGFTMLRGAPPSRSEWTGTFEIDALRGHIDFVGTNTPVGPAAQFVGIYELDGDDLKLCYSWYRGKLNSADRPTAFKSGDNSTMFQTYKRVK